MDSLKHTRGGPYGTDGRQRTWRRDALSRHRASTHHVRHGRPRRRLGVPPPEGRTRAEPPFERRRWARVLTMSAVRGCVFVDRLPFHVQPNHTDWKVLLELARISEYETAWRLKYPD